VFDRRWLLLWCLALAGGLVLSGSGVAVAEIGAAGVGPEHVVSDQHDSANPLVPQIEDGPDPDATVTRIEVDSNGTAQWSITVRMRLDSNESIDGFEAFQQEFERNRSQYLGQFRDRMTGVVADAATVTEREMAATDFEAETGIQEVPRRWGYVTYQFRWQGFAPVESGTVRVGDVFQGGLFLEEDDILIINGPSGYDRTAVDPTADVTSDGRLQWNGPVSFENERPRLVYQANETPSNGDSATPTVTPGTSNSGGIPVIPLTVGILIVSLIGAGGVYLRRHSEDSDPRGSSGSSTGDSTKTAPGVSGANLDELATDEDRVRRLLASEGGRMRQAEIADRLDWSASKTSRVVSEMADTGDVEKLRIGRENVIDLVEADRDEDESR
jgi:hypothetical protein